MPHETRRLVVYCYDADRAEKYNSEVTEVRVWQGDKKTPAQSKPATASAKEPHESSEDDDA